MTPELKSEIDDIIDEFDLLGDWEERYRYLIELGKALPDMSDDERIALLIRLYSGRTSDDILAVDARQVIREIGLAEHLSPQRSNGLNSMIGRIQAEAEAASAH